MPTPSTPPPTSAIVGPSSRERCARTAGRRAARPRGRPASPSHDDRGELPRRRAAVVWAVGGRPRSPRVPARRRRAGPRGLPRRPKRRGPSLMNCCSRREPLRRSARPARRRGSRRDAAVAHDDDEGLEDVSPYCSRNVLLEVEARVRVRRAAPTSDATRTASRRGDRARHRPGDAVRHPEEERALRREHQREEREESERDAPVEAAVPACSLRHRRPCSPRPRPSG